MAAKSAGILVYRIREGKLEVLLVHPGGPFWAKKDAGAWTIPKGEINELEDPLVAAKREFYEETGFDVGGDVIPLTPLKQPSGKLIYAWAAEGDIDADAITSNSFQIEWPPRSGKYESFPEVDRAAWFSLAAAERKILSGQVAILTTFAHLVS